MKVLFVPIFRLATGYTVSVGRKWSVLEHSLLIALSSSRRATRDLVEISNQPERLVMEALINLLRAGWIEVRSTEKGVIFEATAAGKKRGLEDRLPDQSQKAMRWTSLCVERITGSWMRADDLDLVYENDLPADAEALDARIHTFDVLSGRVRPLLRLAPNEALDPAEPVFTNPSRPYARISIEDGKVDGVPDYVSLAFRQAISQSTQGMSHEGQNALLVGPHSHQRQMSDNISSMGIIFGGSEHRALLGEAFANARSHVIVHSCFLDPQVLNELLPTLENASKRGVKTTLLWGLRESSDEEVVSAPLAQSEQVLTKLSADARRRVQLSTMSSGSHAKVLIYDDRLKNKWLSAVGSCNFLSTYYALEEISILSGSTQLALSLIAELISSQLPASGSWSPVARRLNSVWELVRGDAGSKIEVGDCSVKLLRDQDHYACVTTARDLAQSAIKIGCDIFGVAAQTSVLVPMWRAAELGRQVQLYYRRPSKGLDNNAWDKTVAGYLRDNLSICRTPQLHGKFLLWDHDNLAVTSFNWLSTVSLETRASGAELGLLLRGKNIADLFAAKFERVSNGVQPHN